MYHEASNYWEALDKLEKLVSKQELDIVRRGIVEYGIKLSSLNNYIVVLKELNKDYKKAVKHERSRRFWHWWMKLHGKKQCEICPCNLNDAAR